MAVSSKAALRSAMWTGIGFFVSALLAIHYSRFAGGVAVVWIANAFLAVRLNPLPLRVWPMTVAAAALASLVVTGVFGLGWMIAPGVVAVNMFEGVAAALILRRITQQHWPNDVAEWMAGYVLGIGLLVPAIGSLVIGGLVSLLPGETFATNFVNWLIGHALGLLIVLPAGSWICISIHHRERLLPRGQWSQAALMLAAMAVLAFFTFLQPARPLLLLPLLLVVFAAIWANPLVALGLPSMLALVGGLMTLYGYGPIAAMEPNNGDMPLLASHLQFLQIYLGLNVICALPIVAEQERRRRRLNALVHSEARYRLLSDHVSDVIMHLGRNGEVQYASPSITQLTGRDPDRLVGTLFASLADDAWRDAVAQASRAAVESPGFPKAAEFRSTTTTGISRWLETHFRAVQDEEDRVTGLVCVTRDISERKQIEEDLSRAALTDPLTGIPNRRAFFEAAAAIGESGVPAALAVIDIDFFKKVNDRFGHAVGDRVLCAFAEAAAKAVRSTDFVARIGGEEFAVLLPETELLHAEKVCERLARAVNALAVDTPQGVVRITISAGIAALTDDADLAMAAADSALYRAKSEGRARLRVAA